VAFAAYLLYVQIAVINAVCQWCIASDVVLCLAAATCLWRFRLEMVPCGDGAVLATPSSSSRSLAVVQSEPCSHKGESAHNDAFVRPIRVGVSAGAPPSSALTHGRR
jgi:hypothetical protein